MTNIFSIIVAFAALVVAIIFVNFFPGSGSEQLVVGVLGTIFSYFGYEWRTKYDEVKVWVKSKTLWGVLLVAIPVCATWLSIIFGWNFSGIMILGIPLETLISYLINAGGGLFLVGSVHASVKKQGKDLGSV